jgi:hypothetical protein
MAPKPLNYRTRYGAFITATIVELAGVAILYAIMS